MPSYPNINEANRYARDVVNGKILACRYVKQACQRHLDDLKKTKDKNYPYLFNKDAGERICRFIQLLPHTKGEWAKKPLDQARIKLEPWQKFIFSVIFGWLKRKDNTRRFREAYIEVPRKNGKSITAAGIGLYMFCADNEYGAEVYCGATSEVQAWKVFEPALQIAKKLPNLRKKFNIKPWAKKLVRNDGSVFEPVIGDPGDGASPHCGIVDEYHEHKDSSLYDTLVTGQGARQQGLMLTITTAGFNLDSPCYDMHDRVVEMLEGISEDDELFGIVYTIDKDDDWTSTKSLIKANPNISVSVYEDYLAAQQVRAVNRKRFTNTFKTKHLNIWVSAKDAFFNMEHWKACEDKNLSVGQFSGVDCYLGLDLARKLDMNSMARLYTRVIDGKRHYYSVSPEFWIPEDTAHDTDNKRMYERWQKWLNQGVLRTTDGAEVDYREILACAKDVHDETPVISLGIDPHGATALSHSLDDEGITPITITQNYTNLSDPTKELEAAVTSGRFHHDGNPIMTWCISNVIGKHLPGNDDVVRPVKQNADSKIDGALALIMAVGRSMQPDNSMILSKHIESVGMRSL